MAQGVGRWPVARRRLTHVVHRAESPGGTRSWPVETEAQATAQLVPLTDELSSGTAPCSTVGVVDTEGSRRAPAWERAIRGLWPGVRVERLDVPRQVGPAALEALHLRLAARGPFDLLVDLSRTGPVARVVPELVFALRDGGGFLGVRRLAPAGAAPSPFERFLTHELEPWPAGSSRAAFAASIAKCEPAGRNVVLVKRGETLAKIRPRDADRLLTLRPSLGRVVARVPEAFLDVTGQLAASRPAYLAGLPGRIHAPSLSTREYDDVLVDRRQVVTSGHLVLPDSYRQPARAYPHNGRLTEHSLRWAGAMPVPSAPVRDLPGAWFYLDGMYRGHFGHALTDLLSRSWGWAEARRRHPTLKALVFPNRGRGIANWERQLLAAAGIAAEDVVLVERPQRVETLVSSTQMFSNPDYVHPLLAEAYAGIGAALAAVAPDRDRPSRIFSSRRERKRRCDNTEEVEAFFAARGFTVLYPEDHPLAEQVALFRQADVVAGFGGSGMFQLGLAGAPKLVIEVTSETYPVSNEVLLAALVGHRIAIAVCDAHRPPTSGGVPVVPKKADFRFDPAREGAYVDEVLAAWGVRDPVGGRRR